MKRLNTYRTLSPFGRGQGEGALVCILLLASTAHAATVRTVALSGQHAPGTPSGVNFGSFSFDALALNNAGQIAIRGGVYGSGVDSTNDDGIWATDRSGELQLIARAGDQLEVASGDFRTIDRFYMGSPDFFGFAANTGNSDGRPSGFNNLGQLAFWALFIDGSAGVFVSNRVAIPEPSTFLLAGAALGFCIAQRQRHVPRNAISPPHTPTERC